jgi:hypothetical protein
MSRRGNCYDNAAVKSWFSTFKSELGERFESYAEAKEKIFDYIESSTTSAGSTRPSATSPPRSSSGAIAWKPAAPRRRREIEPERLGPAGPLQLGSRRQDPTGDDQHGRLRATPGECRNSEDRSRRAQTRQVICLPDRIKPWPVRRKCRIMKGRPVGASQVYRPATGVVLDPGAGAAHVSVAPLPPS